MATSKDLREQAAELIKQAEAMELKEKNDARDAILALMRENGLSPEDFAGAAGKGGKKKSQKATGTVAPQFRNDETGETWSGRGRAPRWLEGKNREDYRIKTDA